MPNYTVTVTATTNAVAGTEDTFVELLAAAGSALRVKRVHISGQTAASDARITVNLRRPTAAGATGVAFTPVRRDAAVRASAATALVKNGVTAFTAGAFTEVAGVFNANGRATYEWIPRNFMEEIIIAGGTRFAVVLASNVASQGVTITVEYED